MLGRFNELIRMGVPLATADRNSKFHSGGGGSQTVSNEPPSWSVPHLQAIGSMAGDLASQPMTYYPGSTVTPFANETMGMFNMMKKFARSKPGYAKSGLDQLTKTANGDYLNGNPNLDAILNDSMDQTNAMFQGGGRYGSAGHAGAMAENLGTVRANDYARERQLQMDASKYLPMGQSIYDSSMMGRYGALGQIGSALEGKAGEYLQDDMNRWDFDQNEAWNRLMKYASIINPGAGLGGTQTTTAPDGSPIAGALGGVMGAGVGLEALGMASMSNPMFWPVLAGGGLLGAFG